MPYPARPEPEKERGGAFSILDGLINGDNIVGDTLRNRLGSIPSIGLENAGKAWDAAGEGLNFALGHGSVPLSAGIVGLESSAKGAKVTETDLARYTAEAAAQSPGGATGFVAPAVGATYALDQGWNYGVARPASTALLLTDPGSALYNGKGLRAVDENGNPMAPEDLGVGFQLSDIREAFNRSEDVSFGQAVARNPFTARTPIGGVAPLFNAMGGTEKYDPWSDADMAEAQDNPFYVALTGGSDLALQIIVPPAIRGARLWGMQKIGLTNTITSSDMLQGFRKLFDEHTPETPNTWGDIVDFMEKTRDPVKIRTHPEVANNIGADKSRLADVLAETTDRSTINEILLANRGDRQAMVNLSAASGDILWHLAEVDNMIAANQARGIPFRPLGPDLDKVNQVFDSALKRNEYFGTLKSELTAPDGSMRLNSTWRPLTTPVISRPIESIRLKGRQTGAAIRSGDWSDAPQWVQRTMSGRKGRLVTTQLQWLGSKQPLGHVSLSGARPDERLMEFAAQADTVPPLRGNRPVTFEGRVIPASEIRKVMERRLIEAEDAALPDVWREVEDTIVNIAADTYGVDREIAAEIAKAYRTQIDNQMAYMRESNGYLFDAQDGRIIVEKKTMSQMLSSFQTLPMAEVVREIAENGSLYTTMMHTGQDWAIGIHDGVQSVFRTNVLFRPGYVPKNSFMEPAWASFLAHGTIFTDEGLLATARNFKDNMAHRLGKVRYIGAVQKLIKDGPGTAELKAKADALVRERVEIQTLIDTAVNEKDWLDKADVSPAQNVVYRDELNGVLVDLRLRLDAIDNELDGAVPEWRQVVEPPTQADVRAKLREFRAILGDDPDYAPMLEEQGAQIFDRARARVQSDRQVAQTRVDALQRQYDTLVRREEYLRTDYLPNAKHDFSGHSVATDGTQARGVPENPVGPGDTARGRDYQGIALQRQIESLRTQLDEAKAELAAASDEVEIPFTVAERNELRRIDMTLARIDHYSPSHAETAYGPLRPRLEQLHSIKARYPSLNDYRDGGSGGLGPNQSVVGWVKVSTLRKMHGNPRMSGHLESLGDFDTARMEDPLMVEFDPDTGNMFVGEGNHRLDLAAADGEQYLPVRLVRSRISDEYAAQRLAESRENGVLKIEVPESPWKNGQGADYWPPEMHPAHVLGDDVLDNLDVYEAGARLRAKDETLANVRDQVDALQQKYDAIMHARQSFKPVDHSEAVSDLGELAAALDEELARVKGEIAQKEGAYRVRMGDTAAQNRKGSGRGDMTIQIAGERHVIPAALSDRKFAYGTGYAAEASARTTQIMTRDPSRRITDFEKGRWERSSGPREIAPDHELYWNELAFTGNRYIRGDRLLNRYLSGESREELVKWLNSPEGKVYQQGMGKDYLKRIDNYDRISRETTDIDPATGTTAPEITDIRGRTRSPGKAEPTPPQGRSGPSVESGDNAMGRRPTHVLTASTTELDEILRIVDQYFPDKEVQRRLAEGELTASELQAAMAGRTDLSPIAGDDLTYVPSKKRRVQDAVTANLDKLWLKMTSDVEDPVFRWPFAQREFRKQITNRARILHEQGVKLTEEQWNAIRQVSHRAALQELEKTFYNIRRYSTPVYTSRFMMSFPGAFFNSLYRYGRFLVREPERMVQSAALAADVLRWGGIDENGDHVEDIRDAKYFLIPGTKSVDSDGVRIPINSLATMAVSYPSLAIGVLLGSSLFQMVEVKTTEAIRSRIGDAAFEQMYPYGISDNPVETMTAGYQKDWWRAFRGEDDVDVQKFVIDGYGYLMYEWEVGGRKGPQPTIEDAIDDAVSYYAVSGLKKWLSPFAILDSKDGELMSQAWSETQQKYKGDTRAARAEFIKKYGDAARWFTYSGNTRTAYIPPNLEAYSRIWEENPELAKRLVQLDKDNPEMVSLLAYGVEGDYSAEVQDRLRRESLPGDDRPALETMDPSAYEAAIAEAQGWDKYSTGKVKYDAERSRLMYQRDNATSEFERQYYRDKLNGLDTEFKGWTEQLKEWNPTWAAAKTTGGTDRAEKAALYFKTMFEDPGFAEEAASPEFKKVQNFLKQRDTALARYAAAETDSEKKATKAAFNEYMVQYFLTDDPLFSGMYDRYFASEWEL